MFVHSVHLSVYLPSATINVHEFAKMHFSAINNLLGVIQAYINTMPDEWKDDPKND